MNAKQKATLEIVKRFGDLVVSLYDSGGYKPLRQSRGFDAAAFDELRADGNIEIFTTHDVLFYRAKKEVGS